MHWQTTRFRIDLHQPRVMGIVNITPDSFSDGGLHAEAGAAIAHCNRLVQQGADILDLGAESTRPGAHPVPTDAQLTRLLPVLRHALTLGVPVSVDTSDLQVMRAVLGLGVDIVNDVRGFSMAGCLECLAAHPGAGLCLMHIQGAPETMQQAPSYADVVADVAGFLAAALRACEAAGIARERTVLDPGIGFGKTDAHNLALLARQAELLVVGRPLLVGWSRKGTLGAVTGRSRGERLAGSVAAALCAVERGASIVRVHDVAATVDALKVWQAVDGAKIRAHTKDQS
ncbi:MAG: dihydropteroate synthase [Pseudomonadota bacterium]|nr:dihydropteroate synthase [Pseudomonadota bacterium]